MSEVNMNGIFSEDESAENEIGKHIKKDHHAEKSGFDLSEYVSAAFSKKNMIIILWILAGFSCIYLIAYLAKAPLSKQRGGGVFSSNSGEDSSPDSSSSFSIGGFAVKLIDFAVLGFLILMLVVFYTNKSQAQKDDFLKTAYESGLKFLDTPTNILLSGVFLILFYFSMFILGVPMSSDSKPITISVLETIGWCIFVAVIIATFLKQGLGISLTDYVNGTSPEKEAPTTVTEGSGNTVAVTASGDGEVFNISSNVYSYDDAADVCSVFGARLATYDDVEKAYNQGGEWCNYGWTEGQAVYFPTQKKTWEELQKSDLTKNNCGRPGVNGGYMANPYLKFGVNCFGKRPEASEADLKNMEYQKAGSLSSRMKRASDALLEKKIAFWQNHSDELLKINSFNRNSWSEY